MLEFVAGLGQFVADRQHVEVVGQVVPGRADLLGVAGRELLGEFDRPVEIVTRTRQQVVGDLLVAGVPLPVAGGPALAGRSEPRLDQFAEDRLDLRAGGLLTARERRALAADQPRDDAVAVERVFQRRGPFARLLDATRPFVGLSCGGQRAPGDGRRQVVGGGQPACAPSSSMSCVVATSVASRNRSRAVRIRS